VDATEPGGACEGKFAECQQHAPCSLLYACFQACPEGDGGCAGTCFGDHPNGTDVYKALYGCIICEQCSSQCAAIAECH